MDTPIKDCLAEHVTVSTDIGSVSEIDGTVSGSDAERVKFDLGTGELTVDLVPVSGHAAFLLPVVGSPVRVSLFGTKADDAESVDSSVVVTDELGDLLLEAGGLIAGAGKRISDDVSPLSERLCVDGLTDDVSNGEILFTVDEPVLLETQESQLVQVGGTRFVAAVGYSLVAQENALASAYLIRAAQ